MAQRVFDRMKVVHWLIVLCFIFPPVFLKAAWAIEVYDIPFQRLKESGVARAKTIGEASERGTLAPGNIPPWVIEQARENLIRQYSGDIPPEVIEEAIRIYMEQVGKIPAGERGQEYSEVRKKQIPISREQPKVELGKEPPAPVEELSSFERYVRGMLDNTVDRNVEQFGYDLFTIPNGSGRPPSSSTDQSAYKAQGQDFGVPTQIVPVDPSYTIGPGDEIVVRVWGKIVGDYKLPVDREGYVHIPQTGDVYVGGVKYGQLEEFLTREFKKYYSGFSLSARLGKLRTIWVFVVGKARKPGTYQVTSQSTMIHALFAAQGVTKTGTLRDIQLIRNGQVIAHLDLYDLILRGDKTNDKVLREGDVIFIPYVGPLVAVIGAVKEPAIYEQKDEKTLLDVIRMAGGIAAEGYTPQIQVERVFEGRNRTVLDINLKELTLQEDVSVQSGDIVKVFPVDPAILNSINLKGNVRRPGVYAWENGIRVSDIITRPEALKPDSLFDFALIQRLVPPDYHEELVSFHLGKALKGDPIEDKLLHPMDTIYVFNKTEFHIQPEVRIKGAVYRPGDYGLRQKMTVSHLIKLAGGLKPHAFHKGEITRIRVTQDGPVTQRINVELFEALKGSPAHDLPLEENDYLFVRSVPDWELYRLVEITGEVQYPGTYGVKKGERLSSLIERAGRFTDRAYLKGAFFKRASIQEIQKKHYEEMLKRLEVQIAAVNLQMTTAALDRDEVELQEQSARQRNALLARLRKVEPTGRLVIQLAPLEMLKGTPSDIELEDGDVIHIPEVPNSVHVLGSVYNPSAFLYEPDRNVRHYLAKAGGATPYADKGEIYVLKVDGRAVGPNEISHLVTWNPEESRFEMEQFAGLHLDPGDTIIVPEELDRVRFLKGIKDITTIMYQLAVSAGVVLRAAF